MFNEILESAVAESVWYSILSGLPVLVTHFSTVVLMLIAGIWVYTRLTPYDELKLIREGNVAAAVSMSGACLGLAIPLAYCMASSVNVVDIVLWGLVALLIQLVGFKLTDWLLRDLPDRIQSGELAPAILLVGVKLSIATINAAAISG